MEINVWLNTYRSNVLKQIDKEEEIKIRDIYFSNNIPEITLRKIIKEFTKNNLIIKEINPKSKREYILKITNKGKILSKKIKEFEEIFNKEED